MVELVTDLVQRLLEHVRVELDAAGTAGRSGNKPVPSIASKYPRRNAADTHVTHCAARAVEELFGARSWLRTVPRATISAIAARAA